MFKGGRCCPEQCSHGWSFRWELAHPLRAYEREADLPAAARAGPNGRLPAPTSPRPPHTLPAPLQEEIYKQRLAALKREEDMLRGELGRLEVEKLAHIRRARARRLWAPRVM